MPRSGRSLRCRRTGSSASSAFVECGTAASNPIRQNPRQVIKSATSRYNDLCLSRRYGLVAADGTAWPGDVAGAGMS